MVENCLAAQATENVNYPNGYFIYIVTVHEPRVYRIGKVCTCLMTYSISLNHVTFMGIQVFIPCDRLPLQHHRTAINGV